MRKQSLSDFEAQIFRRIGYTVGLWNLLEFDVVCWPLHTAGSLDEEVLVRKVREALVVQRSSSEEGPNDEHVRELRPAKHKKTIASRKSEPLDNSARGKIDVAKALGLIQSPPNLKRHALTPHGRALLAVKTLSDEPAIAVQAFFLWRVLESDSDQFLTLFTILSKESQEPDLETELPQALDRLLKFKYKVCIDSTLPSTLKKRLDEILRVREAKPRVGYPSGKLNKLASRESPRIEIQVPENANYVRHTTSPRKTWLLDLSLMETVRDGSYIRTAHGKHLAEFLLSQRCYQDGLPIIQPEDALLLDLIGHETLFPSAPVNFRFFLELISCTFAGVSLKPVQPSVSEFMEQVQKVYSLVKLNRFQQAETSAIRECLSILRAVNGEWMDFDQMLDSSVRAFPETIALMSSTRARGAYITLKKPMK